ncbi:MAG: hypothetical protein K2X90_03360 [Candidatus Babeliaceae bacterium]|nr:hypothetical protein [Candidatus Babeliaceae bacterium]
MSKWLAQTLIIQLFLVSLSFPLLVSWGIAFSPLIFLGNILFTPVLTLFLALSCVIYMLELFYIPNDYLCMALDSVAHYWIIAMSWAPNLPMIGCPQAPFWVLLVMPLGSWVILKNYGLKNSLVTLCLLTCWVGTVFCSIKWYFTPIDKELELRCGARSVIVKSRGRKIFFLDTQRALQSRACSLAWIDYTLSRELLKEFGATTIDVIVIAKNTPVTSLRLKELCKKYHCKKVFDAHDFSLVPELQI